MADPLVTIMNGFRNYNSNSESSPEIISLTYASFEDVSEVIPTTSRFALVLIEPRILNTIIPGLTADDDLLTRLRRFKGDLKAEGLETRFIMADVYKGAINQDGRTVIALRRFFQQVKAAYPGFEGVTFVGAFPEATLVRRWAWAPDFTQHVMGQDRTGTYLAICPELIDTRSEIVLSDLTGNWEVLYHEQPVTLESIVAYPDTATAATSWRDGVFVKSGTFSSSIFEVRRDASVTFRDAFVIDDTPYTILEHTTGTNPRLRLTVNANLLNPEIGPADGTANNKIAIPDIFVSRINALNIAVDPDPNLRGTDGRTLLDPNGNPQTVTSAANIIPDNQSTMYNFRNLLLERRLYTSYFDRNHRYRVGAFANLNFRTASISGTSEFVAANYAAELNAAAPDFQPAYTKQNANLADYVKFYKESAALRYIIAHSSMWNSGFQETQTAAQLQTEVGGLPLFWKKQGNQYTPSYDGLGGVADLIIHRAMWRNRTLEQSGASIVVHGGCDVNAAYGTQTVPYNHPGYAGWQNAEGILFFTNTVTMLSRAKVFNDSPWGFPEGYRLHDRAHTGKAFLNYYQIQAGDSALARDFAQNKRAYNWSMIGDWSLRLKNRNGLGILSFENGKLKAKHVHPDKSWIDNWNYDRTLDDIKCVGDIDGDGIDEFVLSSSVGAIGVGKFDGINWKTIVCHPKDTWFGSWRYNASVNTGIDKLHGVANLTAGPSSELLLTSSWGIGSLTYAGNGMLTTSTIRPNGTRFGGWLFNSSDNTIVGTGNFDSTVQKEVVIRSPWGLGIISLHTNTSLFLASYGTRLGSWTLNANDRILAIADFDGDGKDEMLIAGPAGIGVLRMNLGTLSSVAVHMNGANLNGYVVNSSDAVWGVGKVRTTAANKEIVIANASGIHVLTLNGAVLQRVAGVANNVRIGDWLINTTDNKCVGIADYNEDGKDELLIQSPWGIGLISAAGGVFTCLTLHPNGSVLGDWHLERNDKIVGSGNFVGGANRAEILIRK